MKSKLENAQLKKEITELSNMNAELLLRPEGPVSIELGKKFLQLGNMMDNSPQLGEKLTTQL